MISIQLDKVSLCMTDDHLAMTTGVPESESWRRSDDPATRVQPAEPKNRKVSYWQLSPIASDVSGD